MNRSILSILLRFIFLTVLQVTVLNRIGFNTGILSYAHFFIYPLWIMLLPFRMPKPILLACAFFMGLLIDMFYDSPGVHAATLVFSAYMRDLILRVVEPDIGYDLDQPFNLKKVGILWYLSYTMLFLLLHLFTYFSIEVFSFVYFYEIMMSTITSLIFSSFIIVIFVMIFNPKQ